MKPARFRYARAESLGEALALLAEAPADTKLLAGGQSLVPMLNMRLVRPAVLLDVNRVRELTGITPTADGGLRLGALTRHAELAASPAVIERAPLLAEAARHVGHAAIRNQGTLGGSLAHADPAAELPAALLALDARVRIAGPRGAREIAADAFFRGLLTTALEAGRDPDRDRRPGAAAGVGIRRDRAAARGLRAGGRGGVLRGRRPHPALSPSPGERGRCGWWGSASGIGRSGSAARSALLAGATLDAAGAARAGAAAGADCDPPSDVHGSARLSPAPGRRAHRACRAPGRRPHPGRAR